MPVVDFRLAGSEQLVPEQHHLLLQRPLGVEHRMKPRGHPHARGGDGLPESRMVAQELIPVNRFSVRVHQLLDRRLIALCRSGLKLVAAGSEASTAHQVSHQGNILASHCRTSCQKRFDTTRIFLPTFRTGCYLRDLWESDQPLLLYDCSVVSIL